MATQTETSYSQIYLETRFNNEEKDLKMSLKILGVVLGTPFLEAPISSEGYLFDLQQVFDHYGWELVVEYHYYVARRISESR